MPNIDLNLEVWKNDDVAVIITKIKTANATRKLGRLEFGMPFISSRVLVLVSLNAA